MLPDNPFLPSPVMPVPARSPVAGVAPREHLPAAHEPPLGARYWRGRVRDELTVRLVVVPHNRIAVELWWNRRNEPADVKLVFGLYDTAVELGMLTGNGFDAPGFHHAGFGTLAVNIGIRALQSTCAAHTPVLGILFNTEEERLDRAQRAPLEASRRAFWRRFGVDVVSEGEPPLDYLQGTVGSMRVVTHGQIAGQFARDVALEDFSVLPPEGF